MVKKYKKAKQDSRSVWPKTVRPSYLLKRWKKGSLDVAKEKKNKTVRSVELKAEFLSMAKPRPKNASKTQMIYSKF